MRPMHLFLTLASLAIAAPVWAMPQASPRDSLAQAISGHRGAIILADSSGNRSQAFSERIDLAALVSGREAIPLLRQAAAMADSLERPDLGATAQRLLAKRYAAAGQYAAAYAAGLVADSLDRLRELHEIGLADEHHAAEIRSLDAERDGMAREGEQQVRTMARAIVDLKEAADLWRSIALAVMLVGLLLVVWLLQRAGKASTKLQATVDGLRQELTDLKARPAARPARPELPKPPPTPMDQAMKPVVEGLFQKAAPERLTTLRVARQRGDLAKIHRVVASLKPQLLAFDAARFAPLIARLKAPAAPDNVKQWAADLDELEKGVEEWAARKDGA